MKRRVAPTDDVLVLQYGLRNHVKIRRLHRIAWSISFHEKEMHLPRGMHPLISDRIIDKRGTCFVCQIQPRRLTRFCSVHYFDVNLYDSL